MKTIQQCILPRVRSNSAPSTRSLYTAGPLSFFDSSAPQPPPSTRLAIEARGSVEPHSPIQPSGSTPFSLTFTSPHPTSSFPYSPTPGQSSFFLYPPTQYYTTTPAPANQSPHLHKRQRSRFQLDVGAYGIPKRIATRDSGIPAFRNKLFHNRPSDDASLSVQVGEDAYFVNNHAMGVADGVGGWARASKHGGTFWEFYLLFSLNSTYSHFTHKVPVIFTQS
jgi:hypothetical protein